MKRLTLSSAGGLAAAVGAVIVSSCCALPTALVFMGVSAGTVSLLAPLQTFRPVLLGGAVALLGAAWVMAVRRRSERAYPVLAFGTGLVLLSFAWAWWDPILQRLAIQTLRS